MNAKQLGWLNAAIDEAAEVEVAEQFTVWTVADEAALEGLLVAIGREQWEELQEYAESHPSILVRGRRLA